MSRINLSKRNKRRIYIWLITILIGGLVSIGYSLLVGGNPEIAFIIGIVLTAGVFGFELFYVQQTIGDWLRKLPLHYFIAISSAVWITIIAVCLQIIPRFLGYEHAYGVEYTASTFQQDMYFALVIVFFVNTGIRIRSLIGGRVLTNFLMGRYHHPLREERVFLFLDIADSTTLSEQLGDIQIQSLIGRFFFDIAKPIAEYDGETHRYIGDEIVVTWPLSDAVKDARCLQCMFEIQDLIKARSSTYLDDFGIVPRFRAGLHGGTIVTGEVGDDKREIVYFGDTVNTAARIQSLCKEKNRDFLVSGKILEMMTPSPQTKIEYMGEFTLRGKSEVISVYALSQKRD